VAGGGEAEHIAWEKEGRNAFAHITTLDRNGYITR
jgi:hypothetical protein